MRHSVVMSCIIKVKDYHYFWGTVKLFKKNQNNDINKCKQ